MSRAYLCADVRVCREYVWARKSVVSTLITIAKSKNGAVLVRNDILCSMDSLFAGENVAGLDKLCSLLEGLTVIV